MVRLTAFFLLLFLFWIASLVEDERGKYGALEEHVLGAVIQADTQQFLTSKHIAFTKSIDVNHDTFNIDSTDNAVPKGHYRIEKYAHYSILNVDNLKLSQISSRIERINQNLSGAKITHISSELQPGSTNRFSLSIRIEQD